MSCIYCQYFEFTNTLTKAVLEAKSETKNTWKIITIFISIVLIIQIKSKGI